MGPLVLLSLIGIGAASAVVDVMGTSGDEADNANSPDGEKPSGKEPRPDLLDRVPTKPDVSTSPTDTSDPQNPQRENAILGKSGNDELFARGTENIFANDGADTLVGWGSGDLYGEKGNDTLEIGGTVDGFGGQGDDYVHISQAARGFGGEGNDTFVLKASQSTEGSGASADGGAGDDTFIMKPLAGLPEDTLPHVLTGGAGADIYALDIDSATGIRDGSDHSDLVVARITDFNTKEDMLLIDIGASANMPDLDTIPTPSVSTTVDPNGGYTDVHISWKNPLNPDSVETRTLRLDGVTDFAAEDVQLTSIFDPNGGQDDDNPHRLFALKTLNGSAGDDTLVTKENTLTAMKEGNDTLTLAGGSHIAHGGDGDDRIIVSKATDGPLHLFGGDGNDVITADLADNSNTALFGGEGDDTITFGLGHYVDGGAGEDSLTLNIKPDAIDNGPAVLRTLTGNHLTINIPPDLKGEIDIVNHTYGNGFEVAYSEIYVGNVPVLKLLEEDFANGVGIAENDPRITILRGAA